MQKTGFTFRGKEIVLSKTRGRPFSGLVKKGMQRGIYPEEKRIEVATIYAATGSMERASELSGVSTTTIRKWRGEEDFQQLLREIWQENNEKIDSKFTEIIEKSLDAIVDRLDNGDFVMTRDGDLKRKPINAKELSLVQAINVDKRQLLRGLPTARTDSGSSKEDSTVKRLEKLADTFENLAKFGRQPRIIDIIEVKEITDASEIRAEAQERS